MTEVATVPMREAKTSFTEAFDRDGDLSLAAFMHKMVRFEKLFCEKMYNGDDFTLRLEVRGNKHVMLHVRINSDEIDRPDGAESRLDKIKKSVD